MRDCTYKVYFGAIVMLSTFAFLGPAIFAAEPTQDSEVLRNLKGLDVEVEAVDREIEKEGLPTGALRTDTLLRLKESGITIVPAKERSKSEGTPYLYVNIRVMRLKPKGYIYGIMVELHEKILNPRIDSSSWVITFRTPGVGGFALNLSTIKDATANEVGRFIAAYLSVSRK